MSNLIERAEATAENYRRQNGGTFGVDNPKCPIPLRDLEGLLAVVKRLPVDADGNPLVEGMDIWVPDGTKYAFSHVIDTDGLTLRTQCGVGLMMCGIRTTPPAAEKRPHPYAPPTRGELRRQREANRPTMPTQSQKPVKP